jgi:hypothetical protein
MTMVSRKAESAPFLRRIYHARPQRAATVLTFHRLESKKAGSTGAYSRSSSMGSPRYARTALPSVNVASAIRIAHNTLPHASPVAASSEKPGGRSRRTSLSGNRDRACDPSYFDEMPTQPRGRLQVSCTERLAHTDDTRSLFQPAGKA